MNFVVPSLLNITYLLSEYFKYFQLEPTSTLNSGVESLSTEDGLETADTDSLSYQEASQQFDFSVLNNILCLLKDSLQQWLESIGSPLQFTDFQIHICETFLIILGVNLFLIAFYWRKYGSIITDRFIRPSTAKEIEELKLSVARLKLPKEHSPRI